MDEVFHQGEEHLGEGVDEEDLGEGPEDLPDPQAKRSVKETKKSLTFNLEKQKTQKRKLYNEGNVSIERSRSQRMKKKPK